MSKPGFGAMIHYLSGGSKHNADEFYGRVIKDAKLQDDIFTITFTNGTAIKISDEGQSCCESRYMTCDDDPKDLISHILTKIEVKEIKEEGDDDVHEIAFLEIATDKSSITIATHNEHNGYYGGFGLSIDEIN